MECGAAQQAARVLFHVLICCIKARSIKMTMLEVHATARSFVSNIMLNNFLVHKVKNYYQHHLLVLLRSCLVPARKSTLFSQYQVALNNAKQDNWLLQNFLTAFRAANTVRIMKIYKFFWLNIICLILS